MKRSELRVCVWIHSGPVMFSSCTHWVKHSEHESPSFKSGEGAVWFRPLTSFSAVIQPHVCIVLFTGILV